MTNSTKSLYAGHRFPPELISYTVWLYFRFPLSLRMVEEMLAFRGIEVSHDPAVGAQVRPEVRQHHPAAAAAEAPVPGSSRHDHGQAGLLRRGEEGDHTRRRAPPAQGAQQSGGKLTPANKATRTPDEAVQVSPTGSALPLRPRPDQQPLPPAPPPNACIRLPRRAGPRLPGVARRLRH